MKRKIFCLLLSLALLCSLLPIPAAFAAQTIKRAGGSNPFTDVKEKDYYYEPVLWAVANSITTGTSKTTFSPDNPCTRAQVVTFLWRAAGSPEPTQTNHPFTDVPAGQYYYKAVLWAVEEGITAGTSKTTFSPDESCTRAQVVTFLWRAAGEPTPQKNDNPFSDVPQGQYYYNAVLWAVEEGVTAGTSKTTFSPDEPCTRGQIVTFIYRYMTSDEPLTIVFQPDDYYMTSSQEDAEFSVIIKGGSAPYTYEWVTCYDNREVWAEPVTSTGSIYMFTRNISDYDFDENRDIGVFCVITDSKGNSVQTEMAEVHPFVRKPFAITSQPNDYRMESSQEDAEFTVVVEGGSAPYTFQWMICYDNEEVQVQPVKTDNPANTLIHEFSDYDFEAYNGIGVYCIITDSKGAAVESEFAVVIPKA